MSIISDFLNSILGTDTNASGTQAGAGDTHPCANCPSDCAIAGDACQICAPFKIKLIDTVYYIDHLDEYMDQYEVTGLSGAAGAITCPYCGAQTQNHQICEYCGSRLSEGSGKIKVSSASEIPNPIMQAQDIIFDRYENVIRQYAKQSAGGDKGFLDELLSSIIGDTTETSSNALGAKMSEAEIKEAASLYGVTVSEYLIGLDNGRYLTLAGRKAAASVSQNIQSDSYTPSAAGIPGLAGIGMFASYLLNNPGHYYTAHHHKPAPHHEPARPQAPFRDDHIRPDRPGSFTQHKEQAPAQKPGTPFSQNLFTQKKRNTSNIKPGGDSWRRSVTTGWRGGPGRNSGGPGRNASGPGRNASGPGRKPGDPGKRR